MNSSTITVGELTEAETLACALSYNPLPESGVSDTAYRCENKLTRKRKARLCEGCDSYMPVGSTALEWKWCITVNKNMVRLSAQWCPECIKAMALSYSRGDKTFAGRLANVVRGKFCYITSKQYHLDQAAKDLAYNHNRHEVRLK
jgi:hypothetical protein